MIRGIIMILYFTGTGNSRFIANRLGSLLSEEVLSINSYMKENKKGDFESAAPYVIVVPIYMCRIPPDVERFLENSTFRGNRSVYFIYSAAAVIGRADSYVRRLCSRAGLSFKGSAAILMPANYVAMYDVIPKENALTEAVKRIHAVQEIAGIIQKNGTFAVNPQIARMKVLSLIAPLFTKMMVKDRPFVCGDSCTGCGQCAALCPKNNILLKGGKPSWQGNCMHCMACISACPQKAINYGSKTETRNRYYLCDK